jgi:rod shape-determining protein MreC
MPKFASTKLFQITAIALLFIGLIFLNPDSILNPMRSLFLSALNPFQKFSYSMSVGLENTKEFISSIGQLKNENEKLRKENQSLLSENAMLGDMKNENAALREQLNLLPRDKYVLTPAFLISQDPNGTGNWLEIDKGSKDGIAVGMPVIVSRGIFIGKIQEVGINSSKVILLTNPKSKINVTTLENGAKGIVSGEYGLGIIFDMVLQTDTINVGDSVITSGIGGEIPRGLYVGTVQEVHQSEDHLFQQAVLTAPLQVSKLQMVFVIKEYK